MAIPTTNIQHRAATSGAGGSSAAGALAARNPKLRLAGAGDEDFAAQLMRAQPEKEAAGPDEGRAPSAGGADKDPGRHDKAAGPADGAPDPAALPPWAQQQQPQAAAAAGQGDAVADILASLRRGAGKGGRSGKDAGPDAMSVDAASAKDGGSGADALAGKGARSAADFGAALGKAGAENAASQTQDSLAALLPQADPAAVQSGAIGAATTTLAQPEPAAGQAGAPAQASLPMPPQSPAFAPALGRQIEVWMRDGIQHAEVQLSPQDLGPIRVRIAIEGQATRVEMSADVPSTRDALQQALPQLSDSLGQVGLSLSGGGVSDQSASQSQGQFQAGANAGQAGGRGGSSRGGLGGHGAEGGDGGLPAAGAARPPAQRRGLLDMYA